MSILLIYNDFDNELAFFLIPNTHPDFEFIKNLNGLYVNLEDMSEDQANYIMKISELICCPEEVDSILKEYRLKGTIPPSESPIQIVECGYLL